MTPTPAAHAPGPGREPADLTVPARFCGPPRSGNGGWTAGALAGLRAQAVGAEPLGTPVTVTLRTPPPLDTALATSLAGGALIARHDEAVVAEATGAATAPRAVPGVPLADARAAEAAYPGLRAHPFDTCFVCGPARAPGDGLRIFPGPVGPRDVAEPRVAATWTPALAGGTADLATTWAALDCVGGWAGDLADRFMVLGRMTAVVHRLPAAGETLVVVGAARGEDGRRTLTAASLVDAAGAVVGSAEHVWFTVDPAAFR